VAAFIVKSLPMQWLRWLVVGVVFFAAAQMLTSALRAPVVTIRNGHRDR